MMKWEMVTEQVILEMSRAVNVKQAEILILGVTFKENCSDIEILRL